MNETRHQRYLRLADSRQTQLIRQINILTNLANTKHYSYTEQDVDRLFDPIEEAVAQARAVFAENAAKRRKTAKPRWERYGEYEATELTPRDINAEGGEIIATRSNVQNHNGIVNAGHQDTLVKTEDGEYWVYVYDALLNTMSRMQLTDEEAEEWLRHNRADTRTEGKL